MAITKLLRIKQVNGSNPAAHLKRNIFYICNPEKTGGGIWIGGNAGTLPENIYNNMVTNKLLWGKQEGSQGFHYVLSFPPYSPVDESLALKIAGEFCEELLGGNFLYCIAVHNDQAHMHAHITFDSVSKTDGYKFHSPKGDWEKRIQPITDRLCEKYHLPTLAYDAGDLKGIDYGSWESAKRSERNREWEKNRTVRADGDRKWENNMRKTPEMNGRNMTMLENDADVEAAAIYGGKDPKRRRTRSGRIPFLPKDTASKDTHVRRYPKGKFLGREPCRDPAVPDSCSPGAEGRYVSR